MNHMPQEIRVLNCAAELVESSVNHVVCNFGEKDHGVVSAVLPKGMIEKKYFFILLLELFSPVNKEMAPRKDRDDNLLTLLKKVSDKPCLNIIQSDVHRLKCRVSEFLKWLDHEFDYRVYSQEIGKHVTIKISRRDVLYLVGNRCKHTLVRSNNILEKLVRKYRETGVELHTDEEILVLADIDNWLFEDFCGYHFATLCELESNLYHSVLEYVRPFWAQARLKDGVPGGYEVPSELDGADIRSEYYSLLNKVSNPWMPHIEAPSILKGDTEADDQQMHPAAYGGADPGVAYDWRSSRF
jgi:hypothetical protein